MVFNCQMKSERRILTDDGDHARLGDFAKLVACHYLILATVLGVCLHYVQLRLAGRRWVRHFPVLTRLQFGRIVEEPRHGHRLRTGNFERKVDLLELINCLQKHFTATSIFYTCNINYRGNRTWIRIFTHLECAQITAVHGSTYSNPTQHSALEVFTITALYKFIYLFTYLQYAYVTLILTQHNPFCYSTIAANEHSAGERKPN